MRAVNLLPKDVAKPQSRVPNPLVLIGGGGGLLVLVALAVMTMSASGTVSEKRDAVADAELRLQQALVPEPNVPETAPIDAELAKQEQARTAALTAALGTRVSWDRILRRFSLVLPDDVWLTSMTATAPGSGDGASAAAPAPGLVIAGRTYSHDGVARLLSRLEVMPDLVNPRLQSSSLTDAGGRSIVDFSIIADLEVDERTEGTS